jgi:acyl-lipid omega-6 desaturase (Delta-12 desaturase)
VSRSFEDFPRPELRRLHAKSTLHGLAIVALDLALFAVLIAIAVGSLPWPVRLASSSLAGLAVGMLFVVGHDACHQAMFGSRTLNAILGRIAFLPALQPYSLWEHGHNRTHHRFTNQKGLDFVFEPLTVDEYRELTPFARAKYRFYRSLPGHLVYNLNEIWWKRMFFPRPSSIGGYRPIVIVDLLLMSAWMIGLTMLVGTDHIVLGLVVPVVFFNVAMSPVIYLQHTHPRVRWTAPSYSPTPRLDQLRNTVEVTFPKPVDLVLHRIMDHTAHHLRPGIPLYRLHDAQARLRELHADQIIRHRWSLTSHLAIIRQCKLVDIDRATWLTFDNAKSRAKLEAPAALQVVGGA